MVKTKIKLREAPDTLACEMAVRVIEVSFELAWEEFIRSCDELGWDRQLIMEGDTKANVLIAMRAPWYEDLAKARGADK